MAFIHGHEHESWHSASMHDILPKLRWEAATFADINRKMPLWEIPLGHIQSTPKAQLLAEGADVYNGSFPLDQVSLPLHSLCPLGPGLPSCISLCWPFA